GILEFGQCPDRLRLLGPERGGSDERRDLPVTGPAAELQQLLLAPHRCDDESGLRPELPRPGVWPDIRLQPVDRPQLQQRLLHAELLDESVWRLQLDDGSPLGLVTDHGSGRVYP